MNVLDLINRNILKSLYSDIESVFSAGEYHPRYVFLNGIYYSLRIDNKFLKLSKYLGSSGIYDLYDVLAARNNYLITHYPEDHLVSVIVAELLNISLKYGKNDNRTKFIEENGISTQRAILRVHGHIKADSIEMTVLSNTNTKIKAEVIQVTDVYKEAPGMPNVIKYYRYKIKNKSPEFIAEYMALLKKYRYIELKKKYPNLVIIQ